MNRTRNWSIVTSFFMLAALGWISTQNTPYIAAALAAIGCLSAAITLIRYEDSVGFYGIR